MKLDLLCRESQWLFDTKTFFFGNDFHDQLSVLLLNMKVKKMYLTQIGKSYVIPYIYIVVPVAIS